MLTSLLFKVLTKRRLLYEIVMTYLVCFPAKQLCKHDIINLESKLFNQFSKFRELKKLIPFSCTH